MSTPTKLISYEDSLRLPEDRFEEILHGESRIMPPPTKNHVFLIGALSLTLRRQLDLSTYCVIAEGAGLGIERDPLTYRIPDLAVFRAEALRQGDLQAGPQDPYIWTVPDLMPVAFEPQGFHSKTHGALRKNRRAGGLAACATGAAVYFVLPRVRSAAGTSENGSRHGYSAAVAGCDRGPDRAVDGFRARAILAVALIIQRPENLR